MDQWPRTQHKTTWPFRTNQPPSFPTIHWVSYHLVPVVFNCCFYLFWIFSMRQNGDSTVSRVFGEPRQVWFLLRIRFEPVWRWGKLINIYLFAKTFIESLKVLGLSVHFRVNIFSGNFNIHNGFWMKIGLTMISAYWSHLSIYGCFKNRWTSCRFPNQI